MGVAPMKNVGYVQTGLLDFNDFDIETEIGFTYTTNNKGMDVGLNDRGYNAIVQYPSLVQYNIRIFEMCESAYDRLKEINDIVKTSLYALFFNDVADNYIVPINTANAKQYGLLVRKTGTINQYQIFKVYQYGLNICYRPIYLVSGFANVEVVKNSTIVSDNQYNLDYNNGVISSSLDLHLASISVSLFFTPVEISSEISITQKYAFGQDIWAGANVDLDAEGRQHWRAEMQLTERTFNYSYDIEPLVIPETADVITTFNLDEYDSLFTVKDSYRVPSADYNGLTFKRDSPTQNLNRTLVIQGNLVQHRQLIRWITFYRASHGTGVAYLP
jgi:hypothetical protein